MTSDAKNAPVQVNVTIKQIPFFLMKTNTINYEYNSTINEVFRSNISAVDVPFFFVRILSNRFIINFQTIPKRDRLSGIVMGPSNHFYSVSYSTNRRTGFYGV